MVILRKYMSLLGIGNAKIDLILPKESYRTGETIHGYFLIKGGTVEQKLKRIDCNLVMVDKEFDQEKTIEHTTILSTQIIESDEVNKVAFTFNIPSDIELSSPNVSYRFNTMLTFNEGVESRDQDIITIV